MPLSRDEQRKLEEIERSLSRDDPKFAAKVTIDRVRRSRVRIATGLLALGAVVIVVGLIVTLGVVAVGVIIVVAGLLTVAGAGVLLVRALPGVSSG
ncbi:MAG TPA: DUF3040 domain-containing protein [Nakamurella sp.]|nr:DUF3040 domain-containing protein [Nakamurella sp.]